MCASYEKIVKMIKMKKKFKQAGIDTDTDENFSGDEYDSLPEKNIRITSDILAMKLNSGKPEFTIMGWSINWNPKIPIYNSRIETIKSEKRWTTIFKNGRCLLPATSFFEYRPFENDPPEAAAFKKLNKIKKKSKFGISLPGEEFFTIGGIYINNKGKEFCSMITTPPHKDMKKIPHHRMPYVMNYQQSLEFLQSDADYLLDNITHYPDEKEIEIKQVSEY